MIGGDSKDFLVVLGLAQAYLIEFTSIVTPS